MALMDDVQAFMFGSHFFGERLNDRATRVLVEQRRRLRAAERFVLEADAIPVVGDLAHDSTLQRYACLARLPHDPVWFELDLHAKLRYSEAMGRLTYQFKPEEASPRLGLLLYQDHETRWVCHSYYDLVPNHQRGIAPSPLTVLFDPSATTRPEGSSVWGTPTLSRRLDPIRASIRGADSKRYENVTPEDVISGDFTAEKLRSTFGGELSRRTAVIAEPFWEAFLPSQRLTKLIYEHLLEEASVLRWLVALLVSINQLPKAVREVPTGTRTRVVGARRVPYLEHRIVSIAIPREDRVVRARRFLDDAVTGDRRPLHRVRGHWRVIERGRSTRTCRHVPVLLEADVALCERCDLLVRWVKDHERGDPTIGTVTHDYAVTKK